MSTVHAPWTSGRRTGAGGAGGAGGSIGAASGGPRPAGAAAVKSDARREDPFLDEVAALLLPCERFEDLARRLSLLSDGRRLRILFCVHARPGLRSSDIARATGANESTTSHALAMLRECGWVRARRSGREVRYELADELAHRFLHLLDSPHLDAGTGTG